MPAPDFAAVFEASPNPYLIADRELRCVAVNAAYCRATGRTREELVGAKLAALFSRDSGQIDAATTQRLRAFEHVFATGRPEVLSRAPYGAPSSGSATWTPLVDAEGRVDLVLEHAGHRVHDGFVHESVSLPIELLQAWLHELVKLPATVSGYANLLRSGRLAPERRDRALASIASEALKQQDMVRDLYAFVGIVNGRFSVGLVPADIADVIGTVVETVQPASEARGVRVDVTITSTATVSLDRERLQRVIRDLLEDAIKMTTVDGVVALRVEKCGGEIELAVTATSATDPMSLRQIFDQFRRPEHVGDTIATMGLRDLVIAAHGGTLAAAPYGDVGVTFTVRLPISHAAPLGPLADARWHVAPMALKGLRVLLIGRAQDTRDHVRTLLERCRARVAFAASAGEALAELQRVRPDVLLLDFGEPGEDSFELIRQIRAHPDDGGRIPVIALIAGDRTKVARHEEIKGQVGKPIEPAELLAVVSSIVAPPHFTW